MSNDNTLVIVAVAVGAFLLLRRNTTGNASTIAGNAGLNSRYFQSPARAYMPTDTQQRQSSQAQLVAGGFGVLSQWINRRNAAPVVPDYNDASYTPPDSNIYNDAPSAPDYSDTDSGQVGDLGDFFG